MSTIKLNLEVDLACAKCGRTLDVCKDQRKPGMYYNVQPCAFCQEQAVAYGKSIGVKEVSSTGTITPPVSIEQPCS